MQEKKLSPDEAGKIFHNDLSHKHFLSASVNPDGFRHSKNQLQADKAIVCVRIFSSISKISSREKEIEENKTIADPKKTFKFSHKKFFAVQ